MATALKREQEAFERELDSLLRDHPGQFVVYHDGRPVGFYDDEGSAYEEALRQFGPDGVFLIACVAKADPEPISVAWDFGIMFGEQR